MGQRTILILAGLWVRVQHGDTGEGGRLGVFGEIFVAGEAHGYADFRFGASRSRGIESGCNRWPNDAQYAAAAAYGHILAQSNLGGHAKSEFDLRAFAQRRIGEEKDSAGTEVLGESHAFEGTVGLAQGERKKIREALSHTAFNPHWSSGHNGVTSFAESSKAQGLL
jgi:hypothetical protein